MSIKLRLPGSLSAVAGGNLNLAVDGGTVGDCLDRLVTLLPKVKEHLFYPKPADSPEGGKGKLRSIVKLRLNAENLATDAIETAVRDSDELRIKLNIH